MFGTLGLHVIKNPAGTYSYVGSIPRDLGTNVPATTSDVMGGRAFRDSSGALVVTKFPIFQSKDAAVEFAKSKGFEILL